MSQILDGIKRAWWSYQSLRKFRPELANGYMLDMLRTRGFLDRVVLAGDFTFGNFGDDLAGAVLAQQLGHRAVLLSSSEYAPRARCLLAGAGGLLRVSDSDPLSSYREVCRQEVRSGLISVGLNQDLREVVRDDFLDKVRGAISRFDFVAVRDHYAYKLLRENGIPVHGFVPDLALLPSAGRKELRGETILLIPCAHSTALRAIRSQLVELYAKLIEQASRLGFKVNLCPFQVRGGDSKDDLAFCREIIEVSGGSAVVFMDVLTEEKILSLYDEAMIVISGRLHGSILAARCGRPFLSLAYNVKQYAFAEMMQVNDFVFSVYDAEPTEVWKECEKLIASASSYSHRLLDRTSVVRTVIEEELAAVRDWVQSSHRAVPDFSSVEVLMKKLKLAC